MRIRSKLLILNIFVNVFAMALLGVLISNIISNYIEDELSDDLRVQNYYETESIEKLLYYDKFDREYLEKSQYKLDNTEDEAYLGRLKVLNIIIDLNEEIFLIGPVELIREYDKEEIIKIFNHEDDTFYNITLFERPFIAFNTQISGVTPSGREYDYLVCSFVTRHQIVEIRNNILIIVLIVIISISLLLILLTGYYGKILIKPIHTLISATEKIARKEFDEKVQLKTSDEFEQLGNSINDMAQSLKNRDIEQKKFYENVSHDIKTPLTVISGYAQGLKSNIFEDKGKTLDKIVGECQSLKKQLENIIFLSKLDTVKEPYKFEQIEINSVMIESLNSVESLVILNEIDIEYTPSGNIFLRGDGNKLKRAFINILSNCIKYTENRIRIEIRKKGKQVHIIVSDNGRGFTQELLKNAFSRDYIGEKDGTGIGLSIIKRVVEGHGGSIQLNNNGYQGATYQIKLPF